MLFLLRLLACDAGAELQPVDADGDGYFEGEDCDDDDPGVSPAAIDDSCDGVDQDCDGHPDDHAPAWRFWYPDADGDGYGDPDSAQLACAEPAGFTKDFLDCNDDDAAVHPLGDEGICDGVDSDCDGSVDEDAATALVFHTDADGDGHGDPASPVVGCEAPAGAVLDATDCDDASAAARPGGEEVCGDGLDGDCDGVVDAACGGAVEVDLGYSPRLTGEPPDASYTSWLGGTVMSLGVGGDSNGDGVGELLVGLPNASPNGSYSGRVYVVDSLPASTSTFAGAGRVLNGLEADSYVGESVGFLRDVDGDGADELLIGAPWWQDQGAVYVLGGGEGATLASPRARLTGGVPYGQAGASVADGGNFLAGGAIVVGAPVGDSDGQVFVVPADVVGERPLRAAASAVFAGEPDWPCAGESLANVGDLDGDGISDLMIGGTGACEYELHAGAAWLVMGPASGDRSLADADARIRGTVDEGGLGWRIAGPGDVDGDGNGDVAIGAPDVPTTGAGTGTVQLFFGAPVGDLSADAAALRLDAGTGDYSAGESVSGAGDVDADGRADLLVGVPYQHNTNGTVGGVYLVTGASTGVWELPAVASRLTGAWDDWAIGSEVAAGAIGSAGGFSIAVGGLNLNADDGYDDAAGSVRFADPTGWY